MYYEGARKNFAENCQLVGQNPMADPQNWNLNNGLHQLATGIQHDLAQKAGLQDLCLPYAVLFKMSHYPFSLPLDSAH